MFEIDIFSDSEQDSGPTRRDASTTSAPEWWLARGDSGLSSRISPITDHLSIVVPTSTADSQEAAGILYYPA